ncbi:hypothetical protein [Streptomyces lincolnensis]|uniref:hypothetical protein n=1 Tax=Streptomyces lincolnensis TaxID=1915 RepID=UPI0037D795AB
MRGMGFLTGGRQERSVGIGLIEALIVSRQVAETVRPVVDRVLWNQLVYVVFKEGALDHPHEQVNAQRLLVLVDQASDASKQALPDYAARIREIRIREIRARL